MKKLLIFILCGTMIATTGYAQGKGHGGHGKGHYKNHGNPGHSSHGRTVVYKERYVKVRPAPPRYVRVAAPRRDYIYVQDDWRWNPAINDWEWYGNRWVPPPAPGRVWVPGSWITVSGGGFTWSAGTWR
jgi:hypothetical protein